MEKVKMENLSFSYEKAKQKDRKWILKNLNLTIEEGETVGIIGANGVGKSTLLKLLVGLMEDYDGSLFVNRLCVENKNLAEIRKDAGFVFQDSDSQLFLSTVYEDVAFAPRNYGYSEAEVMEKVDLALAKVGIQDLKQSPIYRLSGGQKKLVSIATVLSMDPSIIILDEPSIMLDPRNRRRLIGVLNQLDSVKLIATHDLDLILDVCERTILLSNGEIVADGNSKEILSDRTLLEENGLELPLSLSRI